MPEDNSRDEASFVDDNLSGLPAKPLLTNDSFDSSAQKSILYSFWEGISQAGLAETTVRLGTNILLVALILIDEVVKFFMRRARRSAKVEVAKPAPQPA